MELRATILRNGMAKISDILTKMEKNFLKATIFQMAAGMLKNYTEQKTENLELMQQIQFVLNADCPYHAKLESTHWNSKKCRLSKNSKETNSRMQNRPCRNSAGLKLSS